MDTNLKTAIQEKVDKIKKVLGNRCFFCENQLEKENKEPFFLDFCELNFCEVCYNKYKLNILNYYLILFFKF